MTDHYDSNEPERRAIRVDRPYEEPTPVTRASTVTWRTSSKGNSWARVGVFTVAVTPMRYKPGKFSFSYIDHPEGAEGTWKYPPRGEYEFDSLEDAKGAALWFIGTLSTRQDPLLNPPRVTGTAIEDEDNEEQADEDSSAETPRAADPVVEAPRPFRRIRLE